jgi:hypothetical protein
MAIEPPPPTTLPKSVLVDSDNVDEVDDDDGLESVEIVDLALEIAVFLDCMCASRASLGSIEPRVVGTFSDKILLRAVTSEATDEENAPLLALLLLVLLLPPAALVEAILALIEQVGARTWPKFSVALSLNTEFAPSRHNSGLGASKVSSTM